MIQVLENRELLSLNLTMLPPPAPIEGQDTGTQNLATFTFSTGALGDYSATIQWGDGSSSAATVQAASGGGGTISGHHAYAEEGPFSLSVTVQGDGSSASGSKTVAVTDAALAAQGLTVTASPGSAFSGTVATFTDADPGAASGDFSATITWGDGHSASGTVAADSSVAGQFDVSGTNTYALVGAYTIGVAISDSGGSKVSPTGTANVGLPKEGVSFSGPLATFNGINGPPPSSYSATINWGDGSSCSGTIARVSGQSSQFLVTGTHTYAEDGTDSVTVTPFGPGVNGTPISLTLPVQDSPLTASGATSLTASAGTAFTGVVATFTDADPYGAASDYAATLSWGDGSTSTGTFTADAHTSGLFDVTGTHSYAQEGPYQVDVNLSDAGGAAAAAYAPIQVTQAVLPIEGTPFHGTVATFTPGNPHASPSSDTATITWGDGSSSSGTVAADPQIAGKWDVIGTHTYAEDGTLPLTAQVTDNGGTLNLSPSVRVVDATLVVTPVDVSPVEGAPYTGVVATFGDADPNGLAGDYSATIAWGDGSSSSGTIASDPNVAGRFDITGTHTYEGMSSSTVTVTVNDQGGSSASTTLSTSMIDAPLAVTGKPAFTATEGTAFTGLVATFTDADPGAKASYDSAIIDWGDGTITTGTVSADASVAGQFDVAGTHTFAEAGRIPILVTINDSGGSANGNSTVAANGSALVNDVALTAGPASGISATEGTSFSGVVGSFTDTNVKSVAADFAAAIQWGDGGMTVGTIAADPTIAGHYLVSGTYTYATAGSDATSVLVTDSGGSTVNLSGTATIGDVPLSVVGTTRIAATEGTSFTATVGTFNDQDALATPGAFTATIAWGDGSTSTGTVAAVANVPGQFTVSGQYAYASPGSFTTSVQVSDVGGRSATLSGTANVADAALTPVGLTNVPETAGVAASSAIAQFTDSNALANSGSAFTATISWGDGSTSSGTVQADPNSGFDVLGSHAYVTNGTYTASATVRDSGGSTTVVTSTIAVVPPTLSATGTNFGAIEGTSYNGVVATFTDSDPLLTAGNFSVSIAWGDGTTSSGTIAADPLVPGSFDVSGSHGYPEEGNQTATVTIAGGGGGSATSTAVVADASLTATGSTVSPTEGVAFSGVVATFTDASTNGKVSDFTANIDWGDGTTSTGTITGGSGGFTVNGSHTYTTPGTYGTGVVISDVGESSVQATGSASVADAALTAKGLTTLAPSEGAAFTGVVATFTDANPQATASQFTASVDWGDGNIVAASVAVDAKVAGQFDVTATNTYTQAGPYTTSITINDSGGTSATASGTATVADVALTPAGTSITAPAGGLFSGVVATFTDANPLASTGDFSVSIAWGDGNSDPGTIVADPNVAGEFDVVGQYVYGSVGSYTAVVSITDNSGNTTVTANSPVNAVWTVNATEGQSFSGAVIAFTPSNPNTPPASDSATITWGDGTTSAGSVVADPNVSTQFDVTGTHTYALYGSYAMSIQIVDNGTHSTVSTNALVVDAALAANASSGLTAAEGSAFSGTLATFTDAAPGTTASTYNAAIDWGDGTTSTATVVADPHTAGQFDVQGAHTYAQAASWPFTVTINDAGGSAVVGSGSISVADVALALSPAAIAAPVNGPFNGTVATFTDANPQATTNAFSATIVWGNGTSSYGTVVADPNTPGLFDVVGATSYTSTGTYTVTTTLNDSGGASASGSGTANVQWTFTPTEGSSFTGTVVQFVPRNPSSPPASDTATITWGDGTTSSGTVTADPNVSGSDDVTGTHTYATHGGYAVSVQVHEGSGPTDSLSAAAAVTSAPVVASGQGVLFGTQSSAFSGTVATFTDTAPGVQASSFSASITWGDGNTSTGTVVADSKTPGQFDVQGSNTYANPGSFGVGVSVNGPNGAQDKAYSTVSVAAKSGSSSSSGPTNTSGSQALAAVGSIFVGWNGTGMSAPSWRDSLGAGAMTGAPSMGNLDMGSGPNSPEVQAAAALNQAIQAAQQSLNGTIAGANQTWTTAELSAWNAYVAKVNAADNTFNATVNPAWSSYQGTLTTASTTFTTATSQADQTYNSAQAQAATTHTAALAAADQTYSNAVATANTTFSSAQTSAQATMTSADASADTAFAAAQAAAQSTHDSAYAAADLTYANSQAAAFATYNQTVAADQSAYNAAANAAAATRDAALATAQRAHDSSLAAAQATHDATYASLQATYNTAVAAAAATRDAAFVTDQAAYNAAVAAAKTAYFNAPPDTKATGPLDLNTNPAYEAAVAAATATFNAAYNAATATFNAAIAAALNTFNNAVNTADTTYNTAKANADAAYNTAATAAQNAYNAALAADQNTANAATTAAQNTYNSAVTTAQNAYSASLATANTTYNAAVAAAQAAENAAFTAAASTYQSAASAAQTTDDNAVKAATATETAAIQAANNAFQASCTQAQSTYDAAVQTAVGTYNNTNSTQQATFKSAQQGASQQLQNVVNGAQQAEQNALQGPTNTYNAAVKAANKAFEDAVNAAMKALSNAAKANQKVQADADAASLKTLQAAQQAYQQQMGQIEQQMMKQQISQAQAQQEMQAAADQFNQAKKDYVIATAQHALAYLQAMKGPTVQCAQAKADASVTQTQAIAQAKQQLAIAQSAANLTYVQTVMPAVADYVSTVAHASAAYSAAMASAYSTLQKAIAQALNTSKHSVDAAGETQANAEAAAAVAWTTTVGNADEAYQNAVAQAGQTLANAQATAVQTYANAVAAANVAWVASAATAAQTLTQSLCSAGVTLVTAYANATVAQVQADSAAGVALVSALDAAAGTEVTTVAAANLAWITAVAPAAQAADNAEGSAWTAWVSTVAQAWYNGTVAIDTAAASAAANWAAGQGTAYAQYVANLIAAAASQETSDASAIVAYANAQAAAYAAEVTGQAAADANFDTAAANAASTLASAEMSAWTAYDATVANAAAAQANGDAQAAATLAIALAQAVATQLNAYAAADTTQANSVAAAWATQVAAYATAYTTFIGSVASAATQLAASIAAAGKAQVNAYAAADKAQIASVAAAARVRGDAYADAALAWSNTVWPAWASYANIWVNAAADWTAAVWHAYVDKYQLPVASATNTWVTTVAPAQAKFAVAVAQAQGTYGVTMAGIKADEGIAAAQAQINNLQQQPASNWANMTVPPASSWLDSFGQWALGALVGIGKTLLIIGLFIGFFALAAALGVSTPILVIGGIVLLIGGLVAAGLSRWADGQSIGQSIAGAPLDLVGISGIWGGLSNTDIITGDNLNADPYSRGEMFGSGLTQLIATIVGARSLRRGNACESTCFVAGTQVVVDAGADESSPVVAQASAPHGTPAEAGWLDALAGFVEDLHDELGAACLVAAAGLGGTAALRALRKRRRRNREDLVDRVLEDQDLESLLEDDDEDRLPSVADAVRGRSRTRGRLLVSA
jgi:hypothetical protein